MTSKEALDTLRECIAQFRVTGKSKITHDEVINAKYELDKLVERDTPNKVKVEITKRKNIIVYKDYLCPKCNGNVYYCKKHCSHCGQRLSWGEKDEQI